MSPDLKEMRELGDHLWEELSRQKEQPQTDVCPSSVRMESSVSTAGEESVGKCRKWFQGGK